MQLPDSKMWTEVLVFLLYLRPLSNSLWLFKGSQHGGLLRLPAKAPSTNQMLRTTNLPPSSLGVSPTELPFPGGRLQPCTLYGVKVIFLAEKRQEVKQQSCRVTDCLDGRILWYNHLALMFSGKGNTFNKHTQAERVTGNVRAQPPCFQGFVATGLRSHSDSSTHQLQVLGQTP